MASESEKREGIEVLARLSSGGMGEILLARRLGAHGFEKLIALKTIRADLVHSESVRQMFLDEARLVARLSHPCIAQVYDFGELDGALYLAMEYVPGIGLNRMIRKWKRPLPPLAAAKIGAQVCDGLHAAHELKDKDGHALGVVHRDVTPQNLILGFDGRVRILDFGIALMRDREAPETEYGVVKGKPSYMAPEQLRHKAVDRRADIYGISVVLHELLTGQRLFPDDSILATARAIEKGDISAPSSIVSGIPAALDAVVLKGLAKDPEQRYPDARAMALALEQIVQSHEGTQLEEFVEEALKEEQAQHWQRLQALLEGKPIRPDSAEADAPTIITRSTPMGPKGEDAATVFAKIRSSNDFEVSLRHNGPAPQQTVQARLRPPTPLPIPKRAVESRTRDTSKEMTPAKTGFGAISLAIIVFLIGVIAFLLARLTRGS